MTISRFFRSLLTLGLSLALALAPALAAVDQPSEPALDTAPAAAAAPLRVATKTIEPFVFADRDEGFSIDLLKALSAKLDRQFELTRFGSVKDLLGAVEQQQADLGLAAITVNAAREKTVDFTQPMFDSGLQILVPVQAEPSMFQSEIMLPLLKVVGVVLLILIVIAHVVWLLERRSNPDFPPDYLTGIGDALWWAAVTVTTVGYGDKTPKTLLGRVAGLVWMFAGLFVVAYFTSSITSTLTVQSLQSSISSPADLPGKVVVTAANTTSEEYLKSLGLTPVTYPTIAEAYTAVSTGQADALVYDAPAVRYYAATTGAGVVQPVGRIFRRESYGIAVPAGSALRDELNVALLELKEDGTYDQLYNKWFGSIDE